MSFRSKVSVHQIFFTKKQRRYLDGAFTPYDNAVNPRPQLHEYHVFLKELGNVSLAPSHYLGFVSWKFGLKTGVHGSEFLNFVALNPGYDVYFINPFHEYSYVFRNVWEQGDYFHPGLSELARELFANLGSPFSIDSMINSDRDTAFCNYFVGNSRFWIPYISLVRQVIDYTDNNADTALVRRLRQPVDRHLSATYLTFVLERIFSTYLYHADLKYMAYSYPELSLRERCGKLYPHLAELKRLKDLELSGFVGDSERSVLHCYRTLYLEYLDLEFLYRTSDTSISRVINRLSHRFFRKIS